MIDLCDKILKREPILTEAEILNCSGYWIPLQWLYVEMVKKKGISPLAEMGETEKHRYWNLTTGKQWKRICQVQALYCYSQLKTEK
jgi:hypothetical protein